MAASIFGVFCPAYIVLKNRMMSEMLVETFYEQPREVLTEFWTKKTPRSNVVQCSNDIV